MNANGSGFAAIGGHWRLPGADVSSFAIADVAVSNGTMAKWSSPCSSYETITAVLLREKLTKSRCGISKTLPAAVSIRNGLLAAIKSSIRELSMPSAITEWYPWGNGFVRNIIGLESRREGGIIGPGQMRCGMVFTHLAARLGLRFRLTAGTPTENLC